jgi:hypothetical protein
MGPGPETRSRSRICGVETVKRRVSYVKIDIAMSGY